MKLLKILITILTCLSVSILHAQVIPNQGQWEPVGNTILFKQFSDADNTDGVMDGAGLVSILLGLYLAISYARVAVFQARYSARCFTSLRTASYGRPFQVA